MTRQETIQQKTTQQEPIRQELPQPNGEAPRANLRLAIDGMHCANCAAKMENAISNIDGVKSATVSFMTQKLTIEAEEDRLDEIMRQAVKVCRKVEPDCEIVLK